MPESGGVGGVGRVHHPVRRAVVLGCYATLGMLRASPEAGAVICPGTQKQAYCSRNHYSRGVSRVRIRILRGTHGPSDESAGEDIKEAIWISHN